MLHTAQGLLRATSAIHTRFFFLSFEGLGPSLGPVAEVLKHGLYIKVCGYTGQMKRMERNSQMFGQHCCASLRPDPAKVPYGFATRPDYYQQTLSPLRLWVLTTEGRSSSMPLLCPPVA